MSEDTPLRDALRDRIRDLGNEGAVIVGYAAVVEVVTPDDNGPWLKVLMDDDSTPWAHMGRIRALGQIADSNLSAGWEDDDE